MNSESRICENEYQSRVVFLSQNRSQHTYVRKILSVITSDIKKGSQKLRTQKSKRKDLLF